MGSGKQLEPLFLKAFKSFSVHCNLMIHHQRVLAYIPIRSGSKSIPDKNIIDVGGKPLVAYSIEAAKNSKYVDKVIVSTDSSKYADVVKTYGAEAPFLRPPELASDTAVRSEERR